MLKRLLESLGLIRPEPVSLSDLSNITTTERESSCDLKEQAIDFIKSGNVEQINYRRKKEDNYNKLYVEFEMECDDTTGRSTGEIFLDGEKLASAIDKEKSN